MDALHCFVKVGFGGRNFTGFSFLGSCYILMLHWWLHRVTYTAIACTGGLDEADAGPG